MHFSRISILISRKRAICVCCLASQQTHISSSFHRNEKLQLKQYFSSPSALRKLYFHFLSYLMGYDRGGSRTIHPPDVSPPDGTPPDVSAPDHSPPGKFTPVEFLFLFQIILLYLILVNIGLRNPDISSVLG